MPVTHCAVVCRLLLPHLPLLCSDVIKMEARCGGERKQNAFDKQHSTAQHRSRCRIRHSMQIPDLITKCTKNTKSRMYIIKMPSLTPERGRVHGNAANMFLTNNTHKRGSSESRPTSVLLQQRHGRALRARKTRRTRVLTRCRLPAAVARVAHRGRTRSRRHRASGVTRC